MDTVSYCFSPHCAFEAGTRRSWYLLVDFPSRISEFLSLSEVSFILSLHSHIHTYIVWQLRTYLVPTSYDRCALVRLSQLQASAWYYLSKNLTTLILLATGLPPFGLIDMVLPLNVIGSRWGRLCKYVIRHSASDQHLDKFQFTHVETSSVRREGLSSCLRLISKRVYTDTNYDKDSTYSIHLGAEHIWMMILWYNPTSKCGL